MSESTKKRTGKTTKKRGSIRNKLLVCIMPVVVLTIIIIIFLSTTLSKKYLTSMAKQALDSSITNQADNIQSWLDSNMEFFSTTKNIIETTKPDDAELQTILDSCYGFNTNAPNGLFIGTASGNFYKAQDSEDNVSDPASTEWFRQGITRVKMDYGKAYKDDAGDYVVSATGILDDGSGELKVIGADVPLNRISIIVNSGVKMTDASSFLVDTADGTILAHRDSNKISSTISESDPDKLMSGVASVIRERNYESQIIGDYMVDFAEIGSTGWVLVSSIKTDIILSDVIALGNLLILIGVVSVILIVLIILYVINRVIAPLSDITKHIIDMSSGDFTIDVISNSNDEIGLMGSRIHTFILNMRNMISSISNESEKLGRQADSSATVSRDMYDASQSQALAMQNLNETVDQLANAVNEIAQNATVLAGVVSDTKSNSDNANSRMQATVEISRNGRSGMQRLSAAMSGIEDANIELVDSINKVGEASGKITNIVSLIGEISEETNLLSLNASIEAARAGEVGKGFAVVATEIGKLAQTSSESAQRITDLITEVNNLIRDSVNKANESSASIKANTELINSAVETFDQIYENIQATNVEVSSMIENINKVDDVATNVAAISEEQAASADEILEASQKMVDQARGITESSQDVSNNARDLEKTSETLASYVEQFRV
ncbi:methyl-accepting chemotaxis protein [Lachnospiraceae bacterium]|nr:methyl-accepting chemotaxis protein [Lachnospiraceae bacterium]